MSLVTELSSAQGSLRQEANVAVAARCLRAPQRLPEIAAGLGDANARVAGDCAEVMTKVAEARPELVAPYAKVLLALMSHANGRVRWESAHALSLVAGQAPTVVARDLDRLGHIARRDKGVIVRDYALDAIAAYGATSAAAAAAAMPHLTEGLSSWSSKHAARVLRGLEGVARAAPKLQGDIRALAAPFEEHARPGVRKAAKSLLRSLA